MLRPRTAHYIPKDFNQRKIILFFKHIHLGFSVIDIWSGCRPCFGVLLIMHFPWRIKSCTLFEIAKLCWHFFTSLAYRNNSLFIALRWHAFRILPKQNSPFLFCYSKPFVIRVVNRIYSISPFKLKFSLCPLYFLITQRGWLFIKVFYFRIKFFVWHQWVSYIFPDVRQQ